LVAFELFFAMISVVILTRDEEATLSECLDSVHWCNDIVVFDSFSTDQTVAVARARGVRIVQRKFDGYASQRNAALELDFKHRWVLMLDADERVPADLHQEMQTRLETATATETLFRMRRKDFFLGRWLKRSSGYPTWFGRLMRIGHVRVERDINEEYHTAGQVGSLQSHLHHYPFAKGIQFWIERHNRYSTMEATALAAERARPISFSGLFASDPVVRRKVAKQVLYRLPFRPVIVLGYLLFIRGGLLDGRPGISFAVLRAMYEHMIDLKTAELRRHQRGLPV
jgi:glycosyltransferase involved in cell wall biosynthesis